MSSKPHVTDAYRHQVETSDRWAYPKSLPRERFQYYKTGLAGDNAVVFKSATSRVCNCSEKEWSQLFREIEDER